MSNTDFNNDVTFRAGVNLGPATSLTPPAGQKVLNEQTQQFDFEDLGSGASDTVAFADPGENEVLVGIVLEVGTQGSSDSGDTTGLTMIVGISGGDTDILSEEIDILDLAAGFHNIPIGVNHGRLIAAGTHVITLAAVGGGSEDLDDIDAGDWTVHVLTAPLTATY
jgi:hypothetical protein